MQRDMYIYIDREIERESIWGSRVVLRGHQWQHNTNGITTPAASQHQRHHHINGITTPRPIRG